MALEFDTRHAPRRAAQYLELVRAIRSASDADETDWLEWKSQLDFKPVNKADKSALAHVARAIVGFANRQPDAAKRNAEGYAYFVIGVDPQGYYGVEEIDGVDLDQWIAPLVGEDINWWPTYVHITDEGRERLPVLIITVDPPQWGDPIACIRKQLQYPPKEVLNEATIFIRRWGKTDRARAEDIDRLGERLQRARQALDVSMSVHEGGVTPLVASDGEIDLWVEAERKRLMHPFEASRNRNASARQLLDALASAGASMHRSPDERSRGAYEVEVAEYLEALRAAMPALALEVAATSTHRLRLRVHNHMDAHLKGVQVRLQIPEGIYALVPRSAARASNESRWKSLPPPPRLYGPHDWVGSLSMISTYGIPRVPRPTPLPPLKAEVIGDTIVFPAEDARVRLHEDLASVVLMADHVIPDPVVAAWTATATNVDGVAQGTVTIPVGSSESLVRLAREIRDAERP